MEKIDIVYLWCDGSDENWLAKKNKYAAQAGETNSLSNNDCRFRDNEELKYSLRSVERFAPWINKIFIVSDHQIPTWLNTSHPKIRMVNHEEFMPLAALPTFNSSAIEACLHKIPDLSEYFLLANDDMFFGAPTEPSFFYDKGRPVIRLRQNKFKKYSQYNQKLLNAMHLITKKYGLTLKADPHHNIDAYRKSLYAATAETFASEYAETIHGRFRSSTHLQRFIVSLHALAEGKAVKKMVKTTFSKAKGIYSFKNICRIFRDLLFPRDAYYLANLSRSDIVNFLKGPMPHLFCVNDTENTTEENRKNSRLLFRKMFPHKSSFEK